MCSGFSPFDQKRKIETKMSRTTLKTSFLGELVVAAGLVVIVVLSVCSDLMAFVAAVTVGGQVVCLSLGVDM